MARDVPSQLRIAGIAPRFCGILAASMLRWSRKYWVWRFWEQMPQVAARHNMTQPEKSFFHEAFLCIFAVSSTSKRWFVKVSAIQGTFWSIAHGKETSLKWTRRSCCRDSSQELSKILLIFTQIVQLALLLYSLHSCSRPQESGIWIATQL